MKLILYYNLTNWNLNEKLAKINHSDKYTITLFLDVSVIMQGYMMIKFSVAFPVSEGILSFAFSVSPPGDLSFFVGVWVYKFNSFSHPPREEKSAIGMNNYWGVWVAKLVK